MIEIEDVFFQRDIRVHILRGVARGTASRRIKAGTPVQLTATQTNQAQDAVVSNTADTVIGSSWGWKGTDDTCE
jgi:hypothetical protein